MNNERAREVILKGGRISEPLYAVAYGLDPGGGDILAVSAELISDILGLSWPSERGNGNGNQYGPTASRRTNETHWARTFLPQDIAGEQETPLTSLAVTSRDPEVKARIYDVLYERFKKRDYVRDAIANLLACAAGHTDLDNWNTLHDWCARAVFLSGRLGDTTVSVAVLDTLAAAASLVLGGDRRYAFAAFADILCGNGAKHLRTSGLLMNDTIRRWAETLNLVALYYRLNHDWIYVEQIRQSEANTWKLAGDSSAETSTLRTLTEEYIIESQEINEVATMRLQSAMSLATARGFKELLARAKELLPAAIEREVARMKGLPVTLEIEHETVVALDSILERSRTTPDAIRALAATSFFTILPIDEITESAKRALASNPFYAMISSTSFRNNNISHVAIGGSDDKIKTHLSQVLLMRLAKIDRLARHCVATFFGKEINEQTLNDALLHSRWVRPARHEQFREASKHFARQDWYASGTILALAYEGFLRDWLRAAGYPAIKYNPEGTTSDELLNSLAWSTKVETLLSRDYLAMVRYLLCDPKLGLNLRNEVAHANAAPHSFSPGVVLLIALAIIRLSLLQVNEGGNDGAAGDAADPTDSSATVNAEDGTAVTGENAPSNGSTSAGTAGNEAPRTDEIESAQPPVSPVTEPSA